MKIKLGTLALILGLGACGKCSCTQEDYSVKFDKLYRCESNGTQTHLFENDKFIGLKGTYTDTDSKIVHINYGYNPQYDSSGEVDRFDVVNERCEPHEWVNPLNYNETALKEAKRVCNLIDKCHELMEDKYKAPFF